MDSRSRDGSRDRSESRLVKHQHSFSESGRSSVPMWDSSDPERAPPPLPLNPGAPGSPITRSNTSTRIEEAAALIQARARENAPSSYTRNPSPNSSPDKKAQHKRMQTLQNNNVGRLSDSLERRSPDKALRTSKFVEFEDLKSPRADRSPTRNRAESPSPTSRKLAKTENTPPPSMLALQTVRNRQESLPPLADITNGASAPAQSTHSLEALSSQILNITSIATNLQREMASLSKRSKDNATDLISLKEATHSRDEDIRKSLKDLIAGLDCRDAGPASRLLGAPEASRSVPNLGLYLDDKPHNTTPGRKNFSLPRIGSPAGFDRDITASPSLACVDGAASIALLEKVLREMATKDGQDRIMETLENARSQALVSTGHTTVKTGSATIAQPQVDPRMMAKLEDILTFMKQIQDDPANRSLVKRPGHDNARSMSSNDLFVDGQSRGQLSVMNTGTVNGAMNEEILKMMKNVKQSLSQGGGLTNEVKALVRELRGEVLGMGRDIAKKLDDSQNATTSNAEHISRGIQREEIDQIVDEALGELKEHLHSVVQESRKQSVAPAKASVDMKEIAHVVRSAVAEIPIPREQPRADPATERAELLTAIKEAWEECKPEIALEHFGLERDEILETLKEGLKSYQQPTARDAGASYEEVLDAVRKGMADFKVPKVASEETVTRDEIFNAVREVLENFDWPVPSLAPSSMTGSELTRREVVEAVEEGMARQPPVAKEVEFNREDLFDAIKSCLEGEQNPLGGMGERVVEAMHEFLGSMKHEFQQYSAANGKDTEQVLDALKDGLEDLRADIESYVNRGADVTGKDEILATLKEGFEAMSVDIEKGCANRPNTSSANTPELLDAMEKEFQHLRETISKSIVRSEPTSDRDEILDAIRDFADDRQSALSSNSEDIVRLVKDELEHMRTTLAGTLIKSSSSIQREDVVDAVREAMESHRSAPRGDGSESILSNTSELLDAFQDGVDNIRHDLQKLMDRPVDLTSSYEILDTLKVGIEEVRADISKMQDKSDISESTSTRDRAVIVHDENQIAREIEGLKVMITQLRIKVEALDEISPAPGHIPSEMHVHKDDLDELHTALQGIHATVREVKNAAARETVMPSNAASKDDTDAIETLLRNMKAKVDEMVSPEVQSTGKTVQMETMEDMLRDVKATVEEMISKSDTSNGVDLELTELMLKDIQRTVEELHSKVPVDDGILSKSEIAVVESLCSDIKSLIEGLPLPDPDTQPTKDEVLDIRDSIKAFREQIDADNELTARAFEARKVEHGGLANKIDDVKNVIGDLRDELMGKLDGSEEGIVELNKVLGMHHDTMATYATAGSISELSELVRAEFGRQTEVHSGNKSDMEVMSATLFNKHEETSTELKAAIDEKFAELMTKYDDAQQSNLHKLNSFTERDRANAEAIAGTKTVVEDLKSLMDSLGSTVSETCDRISDDSKTVYGKVDEASVKIDDLYAASALEHGQTRDEVAKVLAVATRLEGTASDHHPAILAAIREVLDVVGQHYQHSQHHTEEFARATEEIKTGVSSIPASIPPLLPAPSTTTESIPTLIREVPATKEYDDTQIHDKLNNLISHAAMAKEVYANLESQHKTAHESLSNLDKLDKIHDRVVAAAAEISDMVTTQTRLMAEHHDSRAAEATEAAIALEKRTAQKEKVEAEIVSLSQEKFELISSMAELRKEQAELSSQTKRLTRDVAKLETALTIRQEEMHDMNLRAETLERRIFEGLMNHARTVKNTSSKPPQKKRMTAPERDASMSLKRVPSGASASTVTTKSSLKEPTIGGAVGAVLKKRAPLAAATNGSVSSRASGVDRRILSTSVMGHRGSLRANDRALVLAPAPKNDGFVSLKRSQSVKSNPGTYGGKRKQSWGGVVSVIDDKENLDDDQTRQVDARSDHHDENDEDLSDAGTERRTSILSSSSMTGTSYLYTDSLTYGTGSELSTSSGRTVSYASSIGGTINGHAESIAEEDEDQEEPQVQNSSHAMVLADIPPSNLEAGQDNSMSMTVMDGLGTLAPVEEVHFDNAEPQEHGDQLQADAPITDIFDFAPPPLITDHGAKYDFKGDGSHVHGSDSGLGTEPPTAMEPPQGEAMEYFQMTEEEMRSHGVTT